uniref:Uncharacterized protein n=1 Tax=Siphoviridae sp. ct6d71 TaxID=2826298 RepID=A0A8S5R2Q6_9CAUD|nr:MAG TPA: hypothetical protein [Siphoviridae sp. ct6d71]
MRQKNKENYLGERYRLLSLYRLYKNFVQS